MDELSDEQMLHVLSYLTSRGFTRPIKNDRFEAGVRQIIKENHGLFKRLAEWPEGEGK